MDIKNLIEKLEEKQKYNLNRESTLFFNQPERLFISTENAESTNDTTNPSAYNNFTVNLPRPCLNVKSLQLINANIPKASGLNFNDNELVFYYYRIRTQRNFDDTITIYNEQPSLDNLYYVRLLPSYYKPELIPNNHIYGFNRTFNTYEELSEELAKACANDLAFTNSQDLSGNFYPNDITLKYNETFNKFEMTGNNVNNRLIGGSPPNYVPGFIYYLNDIVYLNTTLTFYIAKQNNFSARQPDEYPDYWDVYTTSSTSTEKIWNTYLIAGFNDPNVNLLMKDEYTYTFPTWNNTTKYMSKTRVTYSYNVGPTVITKTYRALVDNTNVVPTNVSIWKEIDDVPDVTRGVNGISELFDFTYYRYNLNDLVGIPPQPFANKKTLNLKLGFTWNGIYYWVNQTNVIGYTRADYEPLLYNRLRPVPEYEFIPEVTHELLTVLPIPSVGNPYKATTFLADGYCNLVSSSTIYIYTSIIGSSTTDTIKNTNLLAIMPFDCSTLGISFGNHFIDNPLTKICNDIYSIYFEFRNEKGELYNIGNNGICSFVLKLEY